MGRSSKPVGLEEPGVGEHVVWDEVGQVDRGQELGVDPVV